MSVPDIWFTSDQHYFHKGILRHTARPWSTVEEMNEALAEAHNAVVKPRDIIWFLGDYSWRSAEQTRSLHARLKGSKRRTRGNHDAPSLDQLDWAEVCDLKTYRVDGWTAVLCHYPLLSWDGAYRGAVHLHGHSHGHLVETTTRMDVGVDTHPEYRPWHIDEIKAIMATRTFDEPDGSKYRQGER